MPTQTTQADDPSLQELYPDAPDAVGATAPPPVTATGAGTVDATAATAQAGQATAEMADTSQYAAEDLTVTPEMTAKGQLLDITRQDSPLMQRAKQEGMLTAASRGLQNSSIAAGAAQGAMVDRATPIALQDAQTEFQAGGLNQEARNEAAKFAAENEERINTLNAQLGTDVSKFNADQLTQAEIINAQMQTAVEQGNQDAYNRAQLQLAELQTQADLTNADQNFRASLQVSDAQNAINRDLMAQVTELNKQYLTGQQALDLASLNNQYQQLISQNEAAASMYQSVFNAMGDILSNKDIDPARATQAINQMGIELSGALEFMQAMNGYTYGGGTGGAAPTPGTPPPATGIAPPQEPIPGGTPAPGNPGGIPTPGTPEYDQWLQGIIGGLGGVGF